MYRDFSERSKQNILSLVSQVENEKLCDFTDWAGDRWYDFQSWIGKLNIRNYINNVNTYHKKVIDKNNATKRSIEKIFEDVASVDKSYTVLLYSYKGLLDEIHNYIDDMSSYVDPQKGNFVQNPLLSAKLAMGALKLSKFSEQTSETDDVDITKTVLEKITGIVDFGSKVLENKKLKSESNDAALASSFLSYFTGLYTFYSAENKGAADNVTSFLNLVKSSASMWNGLYNYFDKALDTYQASKLGDRFQKASRVVSLIGSACGFSADIVKTISVLMDKNSDGYEKLEQIFSNVSSGAKFVKSGVKFAFGNKQLIKIEGTLKWQVPEKSGKIVRKWATIASLVSVGMDTLSGGTSKYKEVTEDGSLSMNDIGEVLLAGSVKGLTSVVSFWTLGISDVLGLSDNSDKIAGGIEGFVQNDVVDYALKSNVSSEYIRLTKGLGDWADDDKNNVIFRTGVSIALGVGMDAALAVDCTTEVCSTVGNYIKKGWDIGRNSFIDGCNTIADGFRSIRSIIGG